MSAREPSLAAFVVTWNRPESLRTTLQALLAQTWPPDAIFVVDNGDGDAAAAVAREVGEERIKHRAMGENLGPAGGVAFGMRWVAGLGYDWIQVIDDDDPPPRDDVVERLRRLIARHADDPSLGGVGRSGSRWDWRRGRPQSIGDEELHGDVVVDWVGGNQMPTYRRDVIEAIGTYREDLFYGLDDVFFCLRLVRAGWYLLADGDLYRQTQDAKKRAGVNPPGRARRHFQQTPTWRSYYVTRNYIAEMRRSFGRRDLARREVGRAAGRSAAAWLHGPRYGLEVTRLQVRAVLDGYRGRLGRTLEPVKKPRRAEKA
jgi:GT2 family glycosyltransferase